MPVQRCGMMLYHHKCMVCHRTNECARHVGHQRVTGAGRMDEQLWVRLEESPL